MLRKNYPEYEPTNFYFIGDTLELDIKGANESGWESILVKTGEYVVGVEENNNKKEIIKEKYCFENVYDAVKFIIMKEKI